VNEEGKKLMESQGETLSVEFKRAILQGDGSEFVRLVCAFLFWKENNVGLIDGVKVSGEGMEIMERVEKRVTDKVPMLSVEGR
jgi:hypothetical protein